MSKQSEAVKAWRRKTKERAVKALGGCCCVCGYNRCLNALAAHHLNPEEKEFGLGRIMSKIVSWERIVVELRKCVLLCHNCHEEVHAGLIGVPENVPRFNEDYVDYKAIERVDKEQRPKKIRPKKHKIRKPQPECSSCGKCLREKTKTGLCAVCYKKSTRKVKNRPTKEVLLQEIETTSYLAVGRKYGVSDNAIRKWLKA